MTFLFKLARRAARLRAPLALTCGIAIAGCNGDSLTSTTENSTPPGTETVGVAAAPAFSIASGDGIPFGHFHQPTNTFGERYSGGMRNIYPGELLEELKGIKDRGGRVMLNLAGAPSRYTDGSDHFSLSMWKASVDRFKGIDFSSYIKDGTVIGTFLLDEPNDPNNWNGRPVPEYVVEEMARYTKSRWPDMPTVVRVRPSYMTGTYHYLDAAWSQYHSRFGDPRAYVAEDIRVAKAKGLGLVIGFNILKGNAGGPMTPNQIESWGSAMLYDTYPCAFLSWEYDQAYLGRSDIGQALAGLSAKATNRPSRSCRGSDGQTSGVTPDPIVTTSPITLALTNFSRDGRQYTRLTWSRARTSTVDVYRIGVLWKNVENDGRQTFIRPLVDPKNFTYKVCEKGSSICSNTAIVN